MKNILNFAQSDSSNWEKLFDNIVSEKRKRRSLGFPEMADIIAWYIPWLENLVSLALQILKEKGDFSEDAIGSAIEWINMASPKIGEKLQQYYLSIVMDSQSTIELSLKVFRDQFLKRIPTSEAAVERVFSRHKLVHTSMRAKMKSEIVEKMLFVRYNLRYLYPNLSFLGQRKKMLKKS